MVILLIQLLQRIWAIGFPEVTGGKLVLYLVDLANPKIEFNLVPNPL